MCVCHMHATNETQWLHNILWNKSPQVYKKSCAKVRMKTLKIWEVNN